MGRIESNLYVFITKISVCSYPAILAETKDRKKKERMKERNLNRQSDSIATAPNCKQRLTEELHVNNVEMNCCSNAHILVLLIVRHLSWLTPTHAK
jgi:hypothetical protein